MQKTTTKSNEYEGDIPFKMTSGGFWQFSWTYLILIPLKKETMILSDQHLLNNMLDFDWHFS